MKSEYGCKYSDKRKFLLTEAGGSQVNVEERWCKRIDGLTERDHSIELCVL